MIVLKFHFAGYECIDSGLSFSFLAWAAKTLEPLRSNALFV